MRFLFLFFAILLFCFQTVPGNAQDVADTMECRNGGGFCASGSRSCPSESQPTGGTCVNGLLACCKWPQREHRSD
ncbi:UNVERIFIED_CONTAM: hypothetical protein K2H54_036497 [Gekko kuhli]